MLDGRRRGRSAVAIRLASSASRVAREQCRGRPAGGQLTPSLTEREEVTAAATGGRQQVVGGDTDLSRPPANPVPLHRGGRRPCCASDSADIAAVRFLPVRLAAGFRQAGAGLRAVRYPVTERSWGTTVAGRRGGRPGVPGAGHRTSTAQSRAGRCPLPPAPFDPVRGPTARPPPATGRDRGASRTGGLEFPRVVLRTARARARAPAAVAPGGCGRGRAVAGRTSRRAARTRAPWQRGERRSR